MWVGEYKMSATEAWQSASPELRRSQELAKVDCKRALEQLRDKDPLISFRIMSERNTVYQKSLPPHDWRMRWVDA